MPIKADANAITPRQALALGGVALAHLLLRIGGWLNNPQLEDHDSIGYLVQSRIFLSGNLGAIWGMTPDSIPVFPLLMAVFGAVTGDVESGGRFTSLIGGLVALYCVFWLTRRWAGNWPAILAAALLSLNPDFIRWSYAVLSEPAYVGVVYVGVVLFFRGISSHSAINSALMGLVFGLSFLTRFEGILFLAAIPALMIVSRFFDDEKRPWQELAKPIVIYAAAYLILAVPQVVRVSDYMNTFSLNGRSTWSILINAPDERSTSAKIYGLDYDPGVTNLHYLQKHPEEQRNLVRDTGLPAMIAAYAKTVLLNLEDLHDNVLIPLVGIPVLVFGLIGLIVMLAERNRRDGVLVVGFLVVMIAAPLLHNVSSRHIAVLGPLAFCLAAIGVAATLRGLRPYLLPVVERPAVPAAIVAALCVSPYALDTARLLFRPDSSNREYTESAIIRAAREFRSVIGDDGGPGPRVVARKGYFGYFSDARTILMPYTDFAGLVRFMDLNDSEYLFVEERFASNYPFYAELGSQEQFDLLFRETGTRGGDLLLYRRRPDVRTL